MAEKRTDCPDCGGELRDVAIIERGHGNHQVEGLRYGFPEERRSFWRFSQPIEGNIASRMCVECGRILLYGVPKEDPVGKHIESLKAAPLAPPSEEDPLARHD